MEIMYFYGLFPLLLCYLAELNHLINIKSNEKLISPMFFGLRGACLCNFVGVNGVAAVVAATFVRKPLSGRCQLAMMATTQRPPPTSDDGQKCIQTSPTTILPNNGYTKHEIRPRLIFVFVSICSLFCAIHIPPAAAHAFPFSRSKCPPDASFSHSPAARARSSYRPRSSQ